MKYQPPKGTKDFFGEDFVFRKQISEKILTVLKNFGFQQVQTPIIESLDLLQAMAGKEMVGQIYAFKDKGGRELGLRSDITPALTRLFVNTATALQKPIKYSCFDRVYRYERPQEGRYREIYQINAEEFGASAPLADAELLACLFACYKSVNLDVKIIIGYRPLLESFVKSFGITKTQQEEVIRILGKRNKISQEEFNNSLSSSNINSTQLQLINDFLNLRGNFNFVLKKARKFFNSNSTALSYLDDLSSITSRLKYFGIGDKCILQLSLARGSEYYTGIIFEVCAKEDQVSIGGGGRYDKLVPVFGGNKTPAVGFSIGFDRLIDILQKVNKYKNNISCQTFIAYDSSDWRCEKKAIKIATQLRSQDKNVELSLQYKSLPAQLDLAKKRKAQEIYIIEKNRVIKKNIKPSVNHCHAF